MKITRNYAIDMFRRMGQMAFGHLSDETLEAVMNNMEALRAVAEQFDKLKEEMGKRLYEGVEKEKLNAFFEILQKMQGKNDDQLMELDKLAMETYPELYDLRMKEIRVSLSLVAKEVEVDFKEIDGKEFKKAVLKAQPETKLADFEWFESMFKKEKADEKKEDFSELDELMK